MAEINAAYAALTRAGETIEGQRADGAGRGCAGAGGRRRHAGARARPASGRPAAAPTDAARDRSRSTPRGTVHPRNQTTTPPGRRIPLTGQPPLRLDRSEPELRASQPSGPMERDGCAGHVAPDRPSLDEAVEIEVDFGKFHGHTLGEIAAFEPSYIDWLAGTMTRKPEIAMAARVIAAELDRRGIRRVATAAATGMAVEPVPLGGRRSGGTNAPPAERRGCRSRLISAAARDSGPAGRMPSYSARDRRLGSPVPSSVPDGRVVRPCDPWPTPQVVPGLSRVGAFRTQGHRRPRIRTGQWAARQGGPAAMVRRALAPPGPSAAAERDHRPLGSIPHPAGRSPGDADPDRRDRLPPGTLGPCPGPSPPVLVAPGRRRRAACRVRAVAGVASFDPSSPCPTDGRFPGAYPELEALLPGDLDGAPPTGGLRAQLHAREAWRARGPRAGRGPIRRRDLGLARRPG